ncbi:MAG: hypothetical protein J6039_06490, partial [Alphaproteobacteria bacterium]|nr:hypothetical protein [Alphaproteobacteria bacterium]
MKKAHAWRRTLISVILTILGVYLFIPLYSNGNLNYFQSRFNKKALVVVSSDVAISPEKSVCVWGGIDELRCNKASCRLLVRDLSYDWRKKKVSFKPDSDAKISISFGISESKPQTMVDYTDIEINGNKVSKNIARVSKGKPYEKKIEISAGEKLTITFKVRRHHFRLKNLSDLYGFNGYLFISILILTFLGAYKLVNYVAKFKLLENNSRIDIVFVIVFAVLLFIPMSRISTAEKSMQENRMLAKYKPLLTTKGLNLQYGTDFEKWFNDRFFGRKEMLQLYSAVKLYTNNIYENG